jgi:hypothetical protein
MFLYDGGCMTLNNPVAKCYKIAVDREQSRGQFNPANGRS